MKTLTIQDVSGNVVTLPSSDNIYLKNLRGFKSYNVGLIKNVIPFRQGSQTKSVIMDSRVLSFEAHIYADGNELQAEEQVAELQKVFNPYDIEPQTLTINTGYRERKIEARVTSFEVDDETEFEGYHRVTVTMEADDPFFRDLINEVYVLGSTTPKFQFPTEDGGMEFPMIFRSDSKFIQINNQGDYRTPLLMAISGEVYNPVITKKEIDSLGNVIKTEQMKFNVTVLATDTLYIDTTPSEEEVYIINSIGEREDVISKMDGDPIYNYFQIARGRNIIEVEGDTGIADNVSVNYANRYLSA